MSNIVIIDYGSGNLRSVAKAFEHVVSSSRRVVVSANPADLVMASHIILPGVGAYGDCMRGLSAISGMLDMLNEQVVVKKKNFLGICVGMQMMFERGFEHGEHRGLGWLKGDVVYLKQAANVPAKASVVGSGTINDHAALKIPHIGWNNLLLQRYHPVVKNLPDGEHVYFVHSYYAQAVADNIIASTDYGALIAALVAHENMLGMQFHPEKSQQAGLKLLKNFVES